METNSVLTIEDVATMDAVLVDYLLKSESDLAVIIDKGGNVISQSGDQGAMNVDVTIIAALAAGSFAATKELARRIGEIEFQQLYHQGSGSHIFMNSVDDDTIMITVFGGSKEATVGLVRYYSDIASKSLATIFQELRDKPQQPNTFRFDASDIAATTMVEGR